MYVNFARLGRRIKQLASKALSDDDTLLVVDNKGVTKSVPASSFVSTKSLIFSHVSFDGSAGNNYDGSTLSGDNIKSVTRISEGVFKIEFKTPHSTGNYTVITTAGWGNHTSSGRSVSIDEKTATSVTLRVERTDTGTQQDEEYISMVALG